MAAVESLYTIYDYIILLLYGVQGLPVAFHYGSFAQIIHSYTTAVVIIIHTAAKMLQPLLPPFNFSFFFPSYSFCRFMLETHHRWYCVRRGIFITHTSSVLLHDYRSIYLRRCYDVFRFFWFYPNAMIIKLSSQYYTL